MTAVKAEPDSDTILVAHDLSARAARPESNDGAHSRPALTSKSVNHVKGAHVKDKDSQTRKIESLLLKSGQVTAEKDSMTPLIKKEGKPENSISDLAEDIDPPSVIISAKQSAGVKRPAQGSPSKPPKKRELKERVKEIPNSAEIKKERIKAQPETPGKYIPIDEVLYESRGKESGSLFQDLEQQSERDFCSSAASWTLNEWIEQGQQLLDAHTRLIGRLVQHRIELSLKLQVITSAVNDRAAALNEQGLLVDQKLEKIKTLGEEILHII
ncbi:ECM11 (YDR446W) [Zygosaccharomyces parabailii]|uniref:ZYBA0S05-02982g1_1 n=1 Tax=Zygosaccharomyces bailii (strain CLIB 213 / ATCC 58445 / CBS 680 / BCRC 21525 / NBRC 1098 / NCYC 1416 / NRRL Y-2227) TaxID=1333698 RepID=A0A8J2T7B2_ZYGB2|nr:ECM11 (YDR446W) [Zygosaccharomyces parabailii]CDF89841.1 ZYBA0S05-02982g1_1 [Zygosaccharomyces bailii CLIB 213]CDH17600.1 uncharacterized protein ZBAI_09388 [Zygosaccharomyces bailii ISA1307]